MAIRTPSRGLLLFLAAAALVAFGAACPAFVGLLGRASRAVVAAEENPPVEGFDETGSDARAIAIADEVMAAMGGRAHWDATRWLGWTSFGQRKHLWDRATDDVRIEDGDTVTRMNLRAENGRVWKRGVEVTDPGERAPLLERAYQTWVNDSFSLLLPYRLKDAGVTLKYGGEAKLPDGRDADLLALSFESLGVTPEVKYEVLVSRDRHLVEQCSSYDATSAPAPKSTQPWADWKWYGPEGRAILLSGDRGKRKIDAITVFDAPPRELAMP